MKDLNELAMLQWKWVESVGWHNKTTLESLALVTSEVGEAINECRGEKPSEAFGEELADIILRVIDLAIEEDIDIGAEIERKMEINRNRETRGRSK